MLFHFCCVKPIKNLSFYFAFIIYIIGQNKAYHFWRGAGTSIETELNVKHKFFYKLAHN